METRKETRKESPLVMMARILKDDHPSFNQDRLERKNWIYLEIGGRLVLLFFTIGLLFNAISLYMPWFKDPMYLSEVEDIRVPAVAYTGCLLGLQFCWSVAMLGWSIRGGKSRVIYIDAFFGVAWLLPMGFMAHKVGDETDNQALHLTYVMLCTNCAIGWLCSLFIVITRMKNAYLPTLKWSNVVKQILSCGRGRKE